jgi:serine/threonine protein kinase
MFSMSSNRFGSNEALRSAVSAAHNEETLSARVERLGARSVEAAQLLPLIEIVLRACDAVMHMHARGRIHGALTPSCVVLSRDGEISVSQPGLPPEPALVAYSSPEQAWGRSRDLDARTDVHAFGGILFLILTQRAPHASYGDPSLELASARRGLVSNPQALCPHRALPRKLCDIAMRALAADPSERYPSLGLFQQDLARFVHGWIAASPFDRPMLGPLSLSLERRPSSLLV